LSPADAFRTAVSTANKLRLLAVTKSRLHASGERLARVQLRLLRRALARAYREVPLYRERFEKAHLLPEQVRTLADLARLPILEKDAVRDAFPHGIVARDVDLARCRIQQTSGSTGQCLEIALDRTSDDARTLFTQRVYGLQGFTFWRKTAYLFPYPLPLQRNLGLYRNTRIDSNLAAPAIVAELERFGPDLLAATPSDLFDLCDGYAGDLRELGLRAVCCHSEPLSADERAHLAERFGCPVSANYYCNEVWAIAAECSHGTLHQFPDSVVLEIVDDCDRPVPPGEKGHAIVTSLHNHAQPFIRYRLGDVVAWAPEIRCACGLALPALRGLEGRDDDYLLFPDGRRLHPSKVTVAVKSPCFRFPGRQIYRDYRITQHAPAAVRVQIVPGRDRELLEACLRESRENLARLLGPQFEVEVALVPALERGTGRKRKILERLDFEPGVR
jgi:phenylacetate-CoA ligase